MVDPHKHSAQPRPGERFGEDPKPVARPGWPQRWMKMKEHDIEPKQAWRLAGRLFHDVVYDRGIEEKNEWVYASSEDQKHQRKFIDWIESKAINPDENVWVLISYPADDTREMKWREFLSRWTEFLSDSDLKVADKAFSWIFEYKSQRVARFGRKPNIQPGGAGNA